MKIVFMGTPEFAVASLDKLIKEGFEIGAVVTAPDKPAGRGMKLSQSAVKKYAEEKGLPILQPAKLKAPEFVKELQAVQADLFVVVAFRMLPEVVWNMPPLGTINLHGSLLPQYRGAAPINWAIINGETQTGVTTFKLKHEIDTGDILLSQEIEIAPDEDAGSLHDRMMVIGADLLAKTLHELEAGKLKEQPQPPAADSKHAPKLFTETCRIDWHRSVDDIYNLIRGLSPYPGAFTYLDGKKLKIFAAVKEYQEPDAKPGTVKTDGKTFLKFAAANGFISITELQPEGKKRMDIASFLRGYRPVEPSQ